MTVLRIFILYILSVLICAKGNKGFLLKRAGLPPNVDLNNEPPAEDETETNNPTSFASFHEIDLDMAKVRKKVKKHCQMFCRMSHLSLLPFCLFFYVLLACQSPTFTRRKKKKKASKRQKICVQLYKKEYEFVCDIYALCTAHQ